MKAKTVVTMALLGFVAASVAYLVVNEVRSGKKAGAEAAPADGVVVYYFHGAARCETCMKFEAYSGEVLNGTFGKELADGRLTWRAVNVEEPANEHFVKDFELTTRALVVARYRGGKVASSCDLVTIWDLVGDKPAFMKYVEDNVRAYLKE
jgi:hypothetical protein